ncbi:MAG TPA: SDR family oxidoreductase [Candidatus Thermoplasmatota archaeon]|nr:SDR family oxidoreductase [Candidatus Thermoplasmatota archaeon]
MDLGLAGRSAAVMAASEGLGRAAALALAREGARVALCARRRDKLEAAARAIADETGSEVLPIVADVSRADDVARFVETAASRFGGLDVLVTNSGGPPAGRFVDFKDEDWQRAFDLVVMSQVRAVRAALPHLARSRGAVVAIASTSVKQPIDNLTLSNALRASVGGLAKTLSLEHARDGVRFNVVLPGSMATARSQARAEAAGVSFNEWAAARGREIPLGRMGEAAELGDVVAFLASPRASYVTGVSIQVDGGIVKGVL